MHIMFYGTNLLAFMSLYSVGAGGSNLTEAQFVNKFDYRDV